VDALCGLQADHARQHHATEQPALRRCWTEQIAQELLNISDRTLSSTAATIEAKLSSVKIMSAPFTVCACEPIAPMSAAEDSVLAPSPVIATIASLSAGRAVNSAPPREHRHVFDQLAQALAIGLLQLGPGQGTLALLHNAQLGRDRYRRRRMIPRDHDRAHASLLRHPHRLGGLGTWRVDHADDAEKDEVAFLRSLMVLVTASRRSKRYDTERAQGFLGQPIDQRQNVGATLRPERALGVTPALVRAARQ
jgi:hypothetical protein